MINLSSFEKEEAELGSVVVGWCLVLPGGDVDEAFVGDELEHADVRDARVAGVGDAELHGVLHLQVAEPLERGRRHNHCEINTQRQSHPRVLMMHDRQTALSSISVHEWNESS
jgi:hypothetical protein